MARNNSGYTPEIEKEQCNRTSHIRLRKGTAQENICVTNADEKKQLARKRSHQVQR